MRPIALVAFAALLPACGGGIPSNDTTPPDMSTPPDLTVLPDMTQAFPAPHPAPPQVANQGGPTVATPKIVSVFFSNDDPTFTAKLQDFAMKVGATNYWKTATSEYGVGAAVALPPVQLTEAAPATIDDGTIQTWLAGKLTGKDPAWPAIDDQTIYVLHYPAGTTITLPGGRGNAISCQDFGGYHSDAPLGQAPNLPHAIYAVIPRCDNFGGITGVDAITSTESHELVEAVTDPFPMSNPAYAQVDDDHIYWELALGGGEVGDMCAQDPTSFTTFSELPYMVQRTWSNAAALAGHDPCVPSPNQPYFNAAPELNDSLSLFGGTVPGVDVPVGMTKTIALDLFSDGDTGGEWSVKVEDLASLRGQTSTFNFQLDKSSGRNGDKINLSITTLKANTRGRGTFVVVSKLGQHTTYWFGLIGEQ